MTEIEKCYRLSMVHTIRTKNWTNDSCVVDFCGRERETLQQHMTTSRKQRVIPQSCSTHCTCSIAQSVRPFVGRCVRVSPRHPQLESLELAVRAGQRLDGDVVAGRPWCTGTRQPTNRPITTPTHRELAGRPSVRPPRNGDGFTRNRFVSSNHGMLQSAPMPHERAV